MTLYTKSILKEREDSDGYRISIMSRHTLNDGITPDIRITEDKFDEHLIVLAPKPRLIGAYYKLKISWEEFEQQFIKQISNNESQIHLRRISERALAENITLLCIEDASTHCHRRLVAEACQFIDPRLEIIHK